MISSHEESSRRTVRYSTWVRPSWLRPTMFALGAIVVAAFVVYTFAVIRTLRMDAQRVAKLYAEKILPRAYADPTVTSSELGVLLDMIQEMPVAVIVTDEDGIPRWWKGISVSDTARSAAALREVMDIARDIDRVMPPREVVIPVHGGPDFRWTVHVAESAFLRRIAYMPTIAALVTLLFTSLLLWGFWQIKTGEQQALWVGMAKETAHQLGTPLSSLSGWLEILREEDLAKIGDEDDYSIVEEMSSDIDRLKKIAQRFSQVGSPPELHREPVISVIDETVSYFRLRIPRLGREATIECDYRADEEIPLNRELLGWVFENLLKNAIDSLSRTERPALIRVITERTNGSLRVVFEDNGKGATAKELRRLFNPGYSTKKRGWGLGLTFVKRIIEDYHGGKVIARSAGQDQGMTIELLLPIQT